MYIALNICNFILYKYQEWLFVIKKLILYIYPGKEEIC